MKAYKLIAALVFLLLTLSIMSTSAYTPQGEGFVQVQVYAVNDDLDNIVIGNQVDFSIIIQNYWNDTMSNITITQQIPDNTELLSVVGQANEGTNFTDLSVTDDVSGNQLEFTYLNISSTVLTGNLDMTLLEDEFISVNFVLNFTDTGSFNIAPPSISYYDHWGDLKTDAQTLGTSVTINEKDVEPRRQYIPTFDTTEPNYTVLLGGLLAIFVVAILGRLLHFKKPVRL